MDKNTIFIVLGGSGDLSLKKIFPALYDLYLKNNLPKNFAIVSYARSQFSQEEYRDIIRINLEKTTENIFLQNKIVSSFVEKIFYFQGQYDQSQDFLKLKKFFHSIFKENFRTVCYFSIPPICFEDVVNCLSETQLIQKGNNNQVIVLEKPFGYDTESAKALSKNLVEKFDESQIFRIDHYLGKEAIQNILIFRFANIFFEPIWNKDFIKSITISWQESQGIANRGRYFDKSGIIRDVIQNHLIQILALICMEMPKSFCSKEISQAKTDLLNQVEVITEENAFIAQYIQGISNGEKVSDYIQEKNIPKDSKRDTYALLKTKINNLRWQGVPIYLKAGKALQYNKNEVIIEFKENIHPNLFPKKNSNNKIIIRIQPNPQISIGVKNKFPGSGYLLKDTNLKFQYSEFQTTIPNAYERLILDAINSDKTLFISYKELIRSWEIFTPILQKIDKKDINLHYYHAGASNPEKLQEFLDR